VVDGAKMIFSVFDKKRVLRFDMENKVFKVIEFADFENFEENYRSAGSISVNVFDGLIVVCGKNFDMCYYYSHLKHSMKKLSNLSYNHENGTLFYNEYSNNMLCLGGRNTRKVEKYVNDDILIPFCKSTKGSANVTTKNAWQSYPDLSAERTGTSYVIFEKYLYGFFGYNCNYSKYIDSIERLNLESPLSWELITFKKNSNFNFLRANFSAINVGNDQILFVGGVDGVNENVIRNYSYFSFKTNEFVVSDEEINNSTSLDFHRNSSFVTSTDVNSNTYYIGFDEKENVHIIDKNLKHSVVLSFE